MIEKISSKPLVSIITPNFNTPREQLRKTIKSVLNQTYDKFEYIIVDDGSHLPFSGVSNEIDDPRIKWVRLKKNQGAANARNCGAEAAIGHMLAFLDAGDLWKPNKLEKQMEVLNNLENKNAIIYSGAEFIRGKKKRIIKPWLCGNIFKELLIQNNITGSASSVLMPMDIFTKSKGFESSFDIPEDWDLWLRLSKHYPFYFVNSTLVTINLVPNSRSSDPIRKGKSYFRFMLKYYDDLIANDLLLPFLSEYFNRIGNLYRNAGDYKTASIYQVRATKLKPTAKSMIKSILSIVERIVNIDIINRIILVG